MLYNDHLVLQTCYTHHRPDIIHGITLPTIPYTDGACQRVGLTARNTEPLIRLLHLVHFEGAIVSDGDGTYSTTAAAGGKKKWHKRPVPKVEDNSDYIYPADAYGDKYTELAAAAAAAAGGGSAGGGSSSSSSANANGSSRKRVHVKTLTDMIQSTDDEEGWLDSDGEPYVRKKRVAQSALNKVSAKQKAAAAAAAAGSGATNGASSSSKAKGKGKGKAKARSLPPTATAAAAAAPMKSTGSISNGSSSGGGAKVKVKAEPRSGSKGKGKGKSVPTVLPWLYESEVAQQDMVHKCIWIKWNADINAW
jgi:hypothetical protein